MSRAAPTPLLPLAHDLYLQGRVFWNQRTPTALQTAGRYFERAIARDSTYAEAYAALAETYALLPEYADAPPRETFANAKKAALRALALDSTLGQAHAALGYAYMSDWDWRGAEQEFRRAIVLSPSYPTAHQWYAEYLITVGRPEEALAEIERARALDPLARIIGAAEGALLYVSRRYDEAIAQLRRTLELDPDFMVAHDWLGRAYLAKGRYAEAVAEAETADRLSGLAPGSADLAYAYAVAGQQDRARELVRELTARSRREYVSPWEFAIAYTGLGEKEQALAWLERMVDARDTGVLFLTGDPRFDPLRSDPRFTRLLNRVGLK